MAVDDADSYQQWIMGVLNRLSPALESQIRTILSYRFHPRVVLLDVEVFPDGLREGLPMRMFLIDAQNCETFHDDPAYFLPSSIGFLDEITEVIPTNEVDRRSRYEAAGIDTVEIEMAALIDWFIACWMRAGGQQSTRPAYICRHDERESFDLRRMKWEANARGKWTHFLQK